MCGRYASSRKPEDLVEEFHVDRVDVRERLEPDYNVAPTKNVYAILSRPPREDRSAPPQRRLTVVRWGLVPSWAKDPAIGNRMINARVETVAEKPAYKKAFGARRCLLPADGYYEWYTSQAKGPSGRPLKQPFFIRRADGQGLALAGLYEIWRNPELDRDDPEAFLWTCTVITTRAEDAVGHIHDRMPMMVEPERYSEWLDPHNTDPDRLRSLLVPASPGPLEAYPVSREVNDVRHNGPDLVEPLATEPLPPR